MVSGPSLFQLSLLLDLFSGDLSLMVALWHSQFPIYILSFQNPQYQELPNSSREVTKVNLLAPSGSCIYASLNHQGQAHGVS